MVLIALHRCTGVTIIPPLARRGPANAPAQPHRVIVTPLEGRLEVDTRINGKADHVAISPIACGTRKNAHRLRRLKRGPPDHLVNNAIDHPVAPIPPRNARGVRRTP
ncbi:hypothetical protein NBRC106471_2821 [Acetobacter pasteurianus subsp. pasteurianus LMG 1262 = NBRC 106471]|nr:hypothetical protein NBRC106471_2821 [Acetobacter pasteurianus subsp. pasteurianus LMG 1262 = NBRC 106471]